MKDFHKEASDALKAKWGEDKVLSLEKDIAEALQPIIDKYDLSFTATTYTECVKDDKQGVYIWAGSTSVSKDDMFYRIMGYVVSMRYRASATQECLDAIEAICIGYKAITEGEVLMKQDNVIDASYLFKTKKEKK